MGAEIFAGGSIVQGLWRDGSEQVWSVIDELGDAVEQTLNLQGLKLEPFWVFPLKIERDWMSKIQIVCFSY